MSAQYPSFLDGWRTLPEELKLHVLTLTVTIGPPNHGLLSYYLLRQARYWNYYPFRDLVVPLLSIPEIKHLVLEAFYTQNKFFFEYNTNRMRDPTLSLPICLPHPCVKKYVRRIHFSLGTVDRQGIELLANASHALESLRSLSFLEISFRAPARSKCVSRQFLDALKIIEFSTRCLRIAYQHYPMGFQGLWDPLETVILEKISLKADLEPSQTTWKRLACDVNKKLAKHELREVNSWAGTTLAETRWTVKEMSTRGHKHSPYTNYEQKIGLV